MESNDDRIAALEAEIAKLKAQLEPAKPFVRQPMESYDWTERAAQWALGVLADMVRAVGDNLVSELVADRARPVGLPSAASAPPSGGTGWAEPTKLRPPPGVELMDQGMDVQDAIDRAERVKRLAGGGE